MTLSSHSMTQSSHSMTDTSHLIEDIDACSGLFPPPPFPRPDEAKTISAYDRFHGTLDGSYRGGWGSGIYGMDTWQDPDLSDASERRLSHLEDCPEGPQTLADARRCEGAVNRRRRLASLFILLQNHARSLESAVPEPTPTPSFSKEPTGFLVKPTMYYSELIKQCQNRYVRPADTDPRATLDGHCRFLPPKAGSETVDWSSFTAFCNAKEKELWELYVQIRNPADLHAEEAGILDHLSRSEVKIDPSDMQAFLQILRSPQSGSLDFDALRDHFLLMPRKASVVELYRWYSSLRTELSVVTQDGDVNVNGPLVSPSDSHGLQTTFLNSIFSGDSLKVFLAGGFAGAISRTATAPFDRLKVHLITVHRAPAGPGPARNWTDASGHKRFANPFLDAVSTIYRKGGGVKAFWVGNGLNIA